MSHPVKRQSSPSINRISHDIQKEISELFLLLLSYLIRRGSKSPRLPRRQNFRFLARRAHERNETWQFLRVVLLLLLGCCLHDTIKLNMHAKECCRALERSRLFLATPAQMDMRRKWWCKIYPRLGKVGEFYYITFLVCVRVSVFLYTTSRLSLRHARRAG